MDEAQKARLEQLLRAKAEKEAARQEADLLRQLEEEELSAKLEEELKGARGEAFDIISSRFGGVFGLRKPDTQAIRNWERCPDEKKTSLEWQIGLLKNYILPAEKQLVWAQTCAERPALAWDTANAFVGLMGVDRRALEKKS